MANVTQLPINGDNICMICKVKPAEEEIITCILCATPWHVICLASPPKIVAQTIEWECPDCSDIAVVGSGSSAVNGEALNEMVTAIRKIEADSSLSEEEKARRRQELMSGKAVGEGKGKEKVIDDADDGMEILDGRLNCAICCEVLDRPVTTPCGHNVCLKCLQKWIGQGQKNCVTCRRVIPAKIANTPRINSALVTAVRMARMSRSNVSNRNYPQVVPNEDRPNTAFRTERAKRSGNANAASGRIFVTIPKNHFGPILAEHDPERHRGVVVGDTWADRLECRQWGVHFPIVSGIAGQGEYGSQSVVISGGYIDDEDHGDWFLYTGSGGRELTTENKRTATEQTFDQSFKTYNQALRLSCLKGYPVRVVRTHKAKSSAYAPEFGVRYDGIYRVEMCWSKIGIHGFKVCRFLLVRCDNNPAPWTSDEYGDRPRPWPVVSELNITQQLTKRKESPSWDFSEQESIWKWMKPPPSGRKSCKAGENSNRKRPRKETTNRNATKRIHKEFHCLICKQVMNQPVTTPCAHNFCKPCLEGAFAGVSFLRERNKGGRVLRSQKNVMKCPACPTDISDFLQDPQVNRGLMEVIKALKKKDKESEDSSKESDKEEWEESVDDTEFEDLDSEEPLSDEELH